MKIRFTKTAEKEYFYFKNKDKKIFKKINDLIEDIIKNGLLDGIGKPERLRYFLPPKYSRKITEKDRLVYSQPDDNELIVYSCKGHYDDK